MRYRIRLILLIILVVFFCLGTPIVILFSQGYRFDWKQKAVVQTGAIHLKSNPSQVTITLNGKLKRIKPSRFLYSGAIFKNLLPGNYQVAVTNPDFQTWTKTMTVQPTLVSKATRISLPYSSPLTQTLFSSTSTRLTLAWQNKEILLLSENKKNIFSLSLDQGTKEQIFPLPEATTTLAKAETVISAEFAPLSKNILIKTSKTAYVIWNHQVIPLAPTLQKIADQQKALPSRIIWSPFDDAVLFVLNKNGGNWVHLPDLTIGTLLKDRIIGWNTTGSGTYFLSLSGTLYEFSTQRQPTSTPLASLDPSLFSRSPMTLHYLGNQRFIIHEPQGMLLLIDINGLQSELIDPSVSLATISADASRLIYLTNDQHLWVYFLENILDDSAYQQGEKINLGQTNQDSQPLLLQFTNNNWSLILVTEKNTFIFEIDKRLPINSWVISLRKTFKPLWFEENNSSLIYQSGPEIFSSKLLP
jgi:hypothetical protein